MQAYISSVPAVNNGFIPRIQPLSACRPSRSQVAFCMKTSLQAAREEVVRVLTRDLARQYSAPRDLDFSIFDDKLIFDDPTTQLKGKLMYRVCLPVRDQQLLSCSSPRNLTEAEVLTTVLYGNG